jgi:hypothetical protein
MEWKGGKGLAKIQKLDKEDRSSIGEGNTTRVVMKKLVMKGRK